MQMPTFSSTNTLAALFCSLAIVACGPPDEASRAKAGPIVGAFVVSDFFTPSGLMGDGAIPGLVTEDIDKNCAVPRPAGAQGDCYHFLYKIGPVKWAGAYWVFPSNSWGSVPGRDVIPPMDKGPDGMGGELRVYNHVRFSVAINPPMPVPPKFAFLRGRDRRSDSEAATALRRQGHADLSRRIRTILPPCDRSSPIRTSCSRETPVELTGPWQELTIPLDTWSIKNVIGAFGWSMNDTENTRTDAEYLPRRYCGGVKA